MVSNELAVAVFYCSGRANSDHISIHRKMIWERVYFYRGAISKMVILCYLLTKFTMVNFIHF